MFVLGRFELGYVFISSHFDASKYEKRKSYTHLEEEAHTRGDSFEGQGMKMR